MRQASKGSTFREFHFAMDSRASQNRPLRESILKQSAGRSLYDDAGL